METISSVTNKSCLLRCSVSGGLEGFAEQNAMENDAIIQVKWLNRGKSGSQLELQCPSNNSNNISTIITHLRFVEYVYLEMITIPVTATDDKKELLLQQIKTRIPELLTNANLGACVGELRNVQKIMKERGDLGMKALPGVLLPSPVIIDDPSSSEEPSEGEKDSSVDFIVNTIYTKPEVALAVVSTFRTLVARFSPELSAEKDILWLDAGAGTGALLNHLPANSRIGIDIAKSSHPQVHEIDFLQVTREFIFQQSAFKQQQQQLCVVCNPPFAEKSRGDYSAIVKFINQAVELDALYIGLIVPERFARIRVWQSLGVNPRAKLLARFLLPNDSFYDPSNRCGNTTHINSLFVFFGLNDAPSTDPDHCGNLSTTPKRPEQKAFSRFRIEGKRSKGDFPWLRTAELEEAVAYGLDMATSATTDMEWQPSDPRITISAELKTKQNASTVLELYVLLNPKQPLSLANCVSRKIPEHSLGWLALSAKPPIAMAMCKVAMESLTLANLLASGGTRGPTKARARMLRSHDDESGSLVINAMCGEGTIEIESRDTRSLSSHPFFMIAGDKNEETVRSTASRLGSLFQHGSKKKKRIIPRLDLVIWDAQRLPLRDGICDVFLADMPIGGSQAKKHQEPSLGGVGNDNSLDYKRVMGQAARVLKSKSGRAALLSADTKALNFSALHFSDRWSILWKENFNLGGLPAKMFVVERHKQCSKDVSIWMLATETDQSHVIKLGAEHACSGWWLNDMLELQEEGEPSKYASDQSLVFSVELMSAYDLGTNDGMISYCYRIWFDPRVSNAQAKLLEKMIRANLERNSPPGMQMK